MLENYVHPIFLTTGYKPWNFYFSLSLTDTNNCFSLLNISLKFTVILLI